MSDLPGCSSHGCIFGHSGVGTNGMCRCLGTNMTFVEVHKLRRQITAQTERSATLESVNADLVKALEEALAKFDRERDWHSARGGDDYPDAPWVTQARAALKRAKEVQHG